MMGMADKRSARSLCGLTWDDGRNLAVAVDTHQPTGEATAGGYVTGWIAQRGAVHLDVGLVLLFSGIGVFSQEMRQP